MHNASMFDGVEATFRGTCWSCLAENAKWNPERHHKHDTPEGRNTQILKQTVESPYVSVYIYIIKGEMM